ncbi:MAG: cobyric acid synthase CobQ, partial [Candidatus Omnitrophica bacterium]|nr:cobyric acid synthase CobQ [Candidatus Omnitrophota bacterium]
LGVIPYELDLDLLEEDGLSEERIRQNHLSLSFPMTNHILIDVIWLPRISNFTDFSAFDGEPDVTLTYLRQIPDRFPDVLIIPGTKSTIADLQYLRDSGFDAWIHSCIERGVEVIGVCGGYQMLGSRILDPFLVESNAAEVSGLGLLKAVTTFEADKTTHQITAIHLESGTKVKGYEIHMGQTRFLERAEPVFKLTKRGSQPVFLDEGGSILSGKIWGTYLHGIFDSDSFRHHFLNQLRFQKNLPPRNEPSRVSKRSETYDRLAELVRSHLDMHLFYRLLNREPAGIL